MAGGVVSKVLVKGRPEDNKEDKPSTRLRMKRRKEGGMFGQRLLSECVAMEQEQAAAY